MVIGVQKWMDRVSCGWIMTVVPLLILFGCKQNVDHTKTLLLGDDVQITMDEVQRAVSTFNEAMVNPTAELMEALCADALTYGHSSGLIQNKAEFIDDIVNGPFDFSSVEAPDQTIHISGNIAIVRHIFLAKATNAGVPVNIRIGNIQVYQKDQEGRLRLLARQAYKLPLETN